MNTIEKIRAEIERLKNRNEPQDDIYAQFELDVACGYDMAYEDILSFLDKLQEQDEYDRKD